MPSPQELTLPPPSGSRAAGGRDLTGTLHAYLMAGAGLLLIGQLLVGTSLYFAVAVFITLSIVIFTCRLIGFGSIAALLIAAMALNYLVVSQIAKTIYSQPGDSNLAAPETTIWVLLVGFTSICAAAILVSRLIGDRRIIAVNPSPEVLANLRNITFALGLVFSIMNRFAGDTAGGEVQYGGFSALSHQFSGIMLLPILAETWRILMLSRGRSSLSPFNGILVAGLVVLGFLNNSKQGVLDPFVMYFIGTIAYRRTITRTQIVSAIVGTFVFIFFIYPSIQLLRKERSDAGVVSGASVSMFLSSAIQDPTALFEQWQESQYIEPNDLYGYALNYLGSFDALASRFMLIANTDVIVNAVNEDGPYGISLVTQVFEQLVPTFLYPDKPRDFTGDLLTWHYGLRSWDVGGAPTIGIFADSYATMEWTGEILLPFVIMLFFFSEIQLTGRKLVGNFLGCYFFATNFHTFTDTNVGGDISIVLRLLPIYYAIVLTCFFLADTITDRQHRRANRIPAM